MRRDDTYSDALKLAPMDKCIYLADAVLYADARVTWRHGWAMGFLARPLEGPLAALRGARTRLAFRLGYDVGTLDRDNFMAVGTRA